MGCVFFPVIFLLGDHLRLIQPVISPSSERQSFQFFFLVCLFCFLFSLKAVEMQYFVVLLLFVLCVCFSVCPISSGFHVRLACLRIGGI